MYMDDFVKVTSDFSSVGCYALLQSDYVSCSNCGAQGVSARERGEAR